MKEKLAVFLITCILLVGIAVVLVVQEHTVMNMIDKERQANYGFMGHTAAEAEARAERWYRVLFVDTRMTEFSFAMPSEPAAAEAPATGAKALADKGVDWWRARMRVMWSLTFQFFVRLSMILSWAPMALLIFLPFIVDAMVARKIKATNFAITSPHLQLFGTRALMWLPLAFFVLQLMPMVLHPIWTPLTIAICSGSLWIGISHFAKRA